MTPTEIARAIRAGSYLDIMQLSRQEVTAFKQRYQLEPIQDTFGFELEFISNKTREEIANHIRLRQVPCIASGYNQGYSGRSAYCVKPDNSLRLTEQEFEYLQRIRYFEPNADYHRMEVVSPVLTDTNNIGKVMEVLNRPGNPSYRSRTIPYAYFNQTCSLHVHMSVQNYTLEQKKSIFYTYSAIEEHLKDIIADKRIYTEHGKKYAKSVQGMTYEQALKYGKRLSLRTKTAVVDDNGESITFEYRKMNPTRSTWVISNWINIIAQIHRYGSSNTVQFGDHLDLYNVIKSPILQDFFHKRRSFMREHKERLFNPTSGRTRPRRITIGSLR